VFVRGHKRADVVKVNGVWGCLFFDSGEQIKQELYKGHSEAYAESAAENYVDGVKQI
jgi:hypothetical protein|tara:strand:- start:1661 stop:1831 length:171 start_codon:yes stop_codon:yes gene_type:complete